MPYSPGSAYDRQSRQAIAAQDQGQVHGPLPNLLGQDSVYAAPGESPAYDWPNPSFAILGRRNAVARAAGSLGQYDIPIPLLLGQDQLYGAPGQSPNYDYPNPSLGPKRLRDYTFTQSFALPVFQQLPAGASTLASDLPPRAPLRARDYTFTATLSLELLGQDAVNPGAQLYNNPPLGRPRAATLSEPGVNLTLGLVAQSSAPVVAALTELPPRAALKARDYTFTATLSLELLGQDAVNPGAQLFVNPPAGARRAASLGDPGSNQTLGLVNAAAVTLPPGLQAVEQNPRGSARARDYSWLQSAPLHIFQQLPPGDSTASSELPPIGPARSRDYTWLQTLPLHVYQQLPPGESAGLTEGPPRGALRMRDYTLVVAFPQELRGQDRIYGAPGEVPVYHWPVPVGRRQPLRLQDSPNTILSGSVTVRDLTYSVGAPRSAWQTREPRSAWQADTPLGAWHIGPVQE